ncbi:hypothetical protein BUALT_Bualt18G0080800 [Buddleja alternifolia]|uniref:WRKY domain-containing protein n=1 Tax=Buddleja alternifolia TaxID=168488 RepID=A0AAV6W4I2_9LAMI|nr:hypothetical protein BUALT_Bualt18G0080800 [Buddleja alternifolia]
MGGYDDNVAIMGDWMPPSPSPRSFFSSMNGDDSTSENKSGLHFLSPQGNDTSGNDYQYDQTQARVEFEEVNYSNAPKLSSGAGLMERMAARAGFNAPRLNTESIRPADLTKNPEIRSPYLTIPAGVSPTTLLDSPVFLNNSSVLPSPTTGKFSFASSGNNRNSTFMRDDLDKGKENTFEDSSSFAFKPGYPSGFAPPSFPSMASSAPLDTSLLHQTFQNVGAIIQNASFTKSHPEKNMGKNSSPEQTFNSVVAENSPPLDEPPEDDGGDQRSNGDPHFGGAPAEDGYNWRKYGQKQVKGSEYPRSYYKCTHPNCPVKKKVERSHEGHITEIIYKGAHNHPKPPPNRRSGLGPTNGLGDSQSEFEQNGPGANGDLIWSTMQKGENLEATSSGPLGQEYNNGATLRARYEPLDGVDRSSTFSNDEDDDDRVTHGSASLGYDGEGDESESKRRRIEAYASEMSGNTRAIREPRVVVQTTSEVDILDDGYRWRKYGQKVVKGNPNPRSYYKCTSPGCNVRKHVERACHDLKSVITTYEGKHNHDVPAARNSSHASSSGPNTHHTQQASPAISSHIHRPEPSQINTARFERASLGLFGLPGRPQMGPSPGFGYGMSQPGLAMAGLGHNQGRLPAHLFLGHHQHQPMNDMGFMLPKMEPKSEPMTNSGLNPSDESSVYQQFMSLGNGPQM